MKGILVTNHYLNGKKYDDLHSHLVKSAQESGIRLEQRTNREIIFCSDPADFVLFWDKDVHVAEMLERRGLPVFNSARSIELCDDKARTYTALSGTVPQPDTIFAPLSFDNVDYSDFVSDAVAVLGLPVVFKENFGSFGAQVHLCATQEEVMKLISGRPFLLQRYVECGSTDIRIEIVGDKCVAAMRRSNPHDFRANITNGGIAQPYTPTPDQVKMALSAGRALGLSFGGIDIIGENMVCEVNSNAHIINLMECTGIDIAPMIFEYIKGQI